jgi:Nascent polypeptide associated complex NAC
MREVVNLGKGAHPLVILVVPVPQEIECEGKDIIIDNPSVTLIEAQGSKSFQVAGEAREVKKEVHAEISEEDVNMVMEKTGASADEAREALNASGGNIAEAILNLKGDAQ